MAISIDYSVTPYVISVPQSDLTLVTGTLYEMDTEVDFRQAIIALQDDEEGIVFQDAIRHNTEVTVAGTTFARTIEVLNSTNSTNVDEYTVQFTPDSQWSVRFAGSNNNIFDVENGQLTQNQVQVIPTNSGGLINGDISDQTVEGSLTMQQTMRIVLSALAGKLSGAGTGTVTIRDTEDTIDRIVATTDDSGNRITVTLDVSD